MKRTPISASGPLRAARLAVLVLALGATPTAIAALGGGAAPAERSADSLRAVGFKLHGRLGYARTLRHLPRRSSVDRARDEEEFGEVNPELPGPPDAKGAARPKPPAVVNAAGAPKLDRLRRSDAPNPPHPRIADRSKRTPQATTSAAQVASSGTDFTIWRNMPLTPGSGNTLIVSEPTVANDRNGILVTGNKFAAISGDNGITWSYVDPRTMFPTKDGWDNEGGFCCDQIALAVDRGSYSLIFWLQQYYEDPANGEGLLRLVVYQGRKELLDQAGNQSDFCAIDIRPRDFNAGFPRNAWFDFNNMSATKKYLYISSKVERSDGPNDATFLDGLVWRIPLDQLDDADRCDGGRATRTDFSGQAWTGDAAGFNPTLVQQDPSHTTMFWASHCFDDRDVDKNENQCNDKSQINVTKVTDSETEVDIYKREISKFQITDRGDGSCPTSGGGDPCERMTDVILTGYRSGGEVGWFWNVAQGDGFPYPHVRGAQFDTDKVKLIDEPDLWNRDHAVIYPSVGVDSGGDIAITTYTAGGGSFIEARAALVDGVGSDDDWTLTNHLIVRSSSGVSASPTTGKGRWGDYQAVRPYGGCPGTWAAAVVSMQGGIANDNAEPRFAWFGRAGDGCPDLAVVSLGVLPLTIDSGDQIFIGETTRNIGSGTAGASTTRFYLSRDADKSRDDILLGGAVSVGSSGAGVSSGQLTAATVSGAGFGTFYLIGCADDLGQVDEIANADNCLTATDTILVRPTVTATPNQVDVTSVTSASQVAELGSKLTVTSRLAAPSATSGPQTVSYYLSPTPSASGHIRKLGELSVPGLRSGRTNVQASLRMPGKVSARRQFLIVCMGRTAAPDRCVPSRTPLFTIAATPRKARTK